MYLGCSFCIRQKHMYTENIGCFFSVLICLDNMCTNLMHEKTMLISLSALLVEVCCHNFV